MASKRRKRFPLLLYKRYHQIHSGFSKALIVLGVLGLIGLVVIKIFVNPEARGAGVQLVIWASLALLFIGIVRLSFTLLVSKTAYVECRRKSLKIQTPFFPLVVSYRRIKETRPTILRELFPPEKYKKRHGSLLEPYWGETVIFVEIKKLPVSPAFLKIITGPLLLDPGGYGLVLLVEDWMAFSRVLDQTLSDYRAQRAAARQERLY